MHDEVFMAGLVIRAMDKPRQVPSISDLNGNTWLARPASHRVLRVPRLCELSDTRIIVITHLRMLKASSCMAPSLTYALQSRSCSIAHGTCRSDPGPLAAEPHEKLSNFTSPKPRALQFSDKTRIPLQPAKTEIMKVGFNVWTPTAAPRKLTFLSPLETNKPLVLQPGWYCLLSRKPRLHSGWQFVALARW